MDSETLISVNNLQVSFFTKLGEIKAVDGVSYQVKKGKILGIVGESGCGKSVSSYALMGLLSNPGRIVGGEILFNDKDGVLDLAKMNERDFQTIRGKKVSMIFQEPMTALNPVLTIGYQIREQVMKHMGLTKSQAHSRAIDLLDKVGIPSPSKRVEEFPHQLSGGMKQRAMIAMALSCDPDFLIADEPTTALDVTIQAQILDLILKLQDEMKMTVSFITHDLGVISELADDVVVMYAGKIIESGPTDEIFNNPKHPYTQGLLSSIPRFGKRVDSLFTIPGNVPSPLELPIGCAYSNRCSHVTDECLSKRPQLLEVGSNGTKVSCFNPVNK